MFVEIKKTINSVKYSWGVHFSWPSCRCCRQCCHQFQQQTMKKKSCSRASCLKRLLNPAGTNPPMTQNSSAATAAASSLKRHHGNPHVVKVKSHVRAFSRHHHLSKRSQKQQYARYLHPTEHTEQNEAQNILISVVTN